jgi:Flp pilus assembly protein TadG
MMVLSGLFPLLGVVLIAVASWINFKANRHAEAADARCAIATALAQGHVITERQRAAHQSFIYAYAGRLSPADRAAWDCDPLVIAWKAACEKEHEKP